MHFVNSFVLADVDKHSSSKFIQHVLESSLPFHLNAAMNKRQFLYLLTPKMAQTDG